MKKVWIAILLMGAFVLTGCNQTSQETLTKDEMKFKKEYESLNDKKRGEHNVMSIKVPEDNQMKYVDSDEVIDILEHKTGVIYFGFPSCPWCRNIVPILIDAAKETGLETIYYANLLEERDSKHLDEDGNIVVDQEGSENYHKIVDLLKDKLGVYEGLEDDSIKRLYFPTLVFVKNGNVEDIHIGTLDSQKDPYKALNHKQKEKLKNLCLNKIEKIQSLTCDTDKTC